MQKALRSIKTQELDASNIGGQQAPHHGATLPQVDGADDTQVIPSLYSVLWYLYPELLSPQLMQRFQSYLTFTEPRMPSFIVAC
jgi:hypothetical protein